MSDGTTYKVWIYVEKVNDDEGIYENIRPEPDLALEHEDKELAVLAAGMLTDWGSVAQVKATNVLRAERELHSS